MINRHHLSFIIVIHRRRSTRPDPTLKSEGTQPRVEAMPPKQHSSSTDPILSTEDLQPMLPFQRSLLQQLLPRTVDSDPDDPNSTRQGDALLLMARGLGMRSIIATLVSTLSFSLFEAVTAQTLSPEWLNPHLSSHVVEDI